MRISVTFRAYRGRASHSFTCPACGKPKRSRVFTVEHTVNPFNKNADGFVKTASEVWREAQRAAEAELAAFKREPLCSTCENSLPYRERSALRQRRQNIGAQT